MRKKNAGRWRWLLLRQKEPMLWGFNNPLRQEATYKVVKTGASKYDGAYTFWEILAEYDDPKTAHAMLDVVKASNTTQGEPQ